MSLAYEYLPMALFLLVGTLANLPFLARAIYELATAKTRRRFSALPSAAPALVGVSISECAWVLPCLVQCSLCFFRGTDGQWSPMTSVVGCNVMGFYSVFASYSGMMTTLWIIYLTYRKSTGSPALGARIGVAVPVIIFFGALLMSTLPFMGVGSFQWTGEGFCYFDWRSIPLSILMLLITLLALGGAVIMLVMTYRRQTWPSKIDLIVMLVAFVSAWFLWVPATIIGLSDGVFPPKYLLMGAIFGHAQALLNPYIYGIRWRRTVVSMAAEKPTEKVLLGHRDSFPISEQDA